MRIGFASDIHRLINNRPLMLGGVVVPFPMGEDAHSDGDVVYHALAESILGALALGDLGHHFPDTSDETLNINSAIIVQKVVSMMEKANYRVNNVDISITLEQPKLKNYILKMRENIALLLKVSINQISVKAGTNEKLDALGENKAVKAESIVLLEEVNNGNY